jgi:hypothetical protein
VQNIHAYLHEVAGVRQQILKAQSTNDFDTNGNLLNLNNIGSLKWCYNNSLNQLTKADKPNTTQYYIYDYQGFSATVVVRVDGEGLLPITTVCLVR